MATHHSTLLEHIATNQAILQRFWESLIFANAKKCEFH